MYYAIPGDLIFTQVNKIGVIPIYFSFLVLLFDTIYEIMIEQFVVQGSEKLCI